MSAARFRRARALAVGSLIGALSVALGADARVSAQPPSPAAAPAEEPAPLAVPTGDVASESNPDNLASVGDPWGADAGGHTLQGLSFRTLFQLRYGSTFAAASANPRASYAVTEDYLAQQDDGWALNRLFLRVSAAPDSMLRFRMILDFAELLHDDAQDVVKQAYVTFRPLPEHLEISAGLLKLPYSTLELDPIAKYELADVGPADDLVKDLGFAGRDLGALVSYAPLSKAKRLVFSAGAFRGHAHDEHDFPAGTLGARVESEPTKSLRFGLDAVVQPSSNSYDQPLSTSDKDVIPNPPDPQYPRQKRWSQGAAYSADAKFRRWGLSLRAEAMYGARVDEANRYGARRFDAFWVLASYRLHVGPATLIPALRAEWLDGDLQHSVGLRRLLSAAVGAALGDHARVTLDVSRTDVQSGSPLLHQPRPLQDPPYLELDRTRVTVQLQAEI